MRVNWFCNLMMYQNWVWSILLFRMKFELDYGQFSYVLSLCLLILSSQTCSLFSRLCVSVRCGIRVRLLWLVWICFHIWIMGFNAFFRFTIEASNVLSCWYFSLLLSFCFKSQIQPKTHDILWYWVIFLFSFPGFKFDWVCGL